MTQIAIAREGRVENNCVIEPGAIFCEDESVPVYWGRDTDLVVGQASDLQRVGDAVTMDVNLYGTVQVDFEDRIEAYFYAQPFDGVEHPMAPGALSIVTSARVRHVAIRLDAH